jgi:hypothetical protein
MSKTKVWVSQGFRDELVAHTGDFLFLVEISMMNWLAFRLRFNINIEKNLVDEKDLLWHIDRHKLKELRMKEICQKYCLLFADENENYGLVDYENVFTEFVHITDDYFKFMKDKIILLAGKKVIR